MVSSVLCMRRIQKDWSPQGLSHDCIWHSTENRLHQKEDEEVNRNGGGLCQVDDKCQKWEGKILVTLLTDSESTRSLQPMANGLVKRFERRQRENSLLLHLDRACILFIKGCYFWFTTFLVLFVLQPLVQVWVHFSFIVYIVLSFKCFFFSTGTVLFE